MLVVSIVAKGQGSTTKGHFRYKVFFSRFQNNIKLEISHIFSEMAFIFNKAYNRKSRILVLFVGIRYVSVCLICCIWLNGSLVIIFVFPFYGCFYIVLCSLLIQQAKWIFCYDKTFAECIFTYSHFTFIELDICINSVSQSSIYSNEYCQYVCIS